MSLTINEPIKTVNGILTKAIAVNTQLLYTIQTSVDVTSVQNYRIELEIRDALDTFSLFNNVFVYVPNQAGKLDLDVGGIVTSYMKSNGLFSFEYFIRVIEVWEGSVEVSVDTTILQAVLASKQLLSVGGANMWENLLRVGSELAVQLPTTGVINNAGLVQVNLSDSTGILLNDWIHLKTDDGIYDIISKCNIVNPTSLRLDAAYTQDAGVGTVSANNAKQLTRFKNPVMWHGWNRTTANSLIDSEYVARVGVGTTGFRWVQQVYDINKENVLIQTSGSFSTDLTPRIIHRDYSNVDIPANGQWVLTSIVPTPSNTPNLTEDVWYRLKDECSNPIMIDWINSLGGIDQWLFSNSQQVQVVSDSGIVAERPITTDVEFITRTKRRFANTFRQQITLRANNLTRDQLYALQDIKNTESLRVYLSKDGSNFIDGVVITSFTTDYNRKDSTHSFILIIELPNGFILGQGLLY